jgi:hypothetical protein
MRVVGLERIVETEDEYLDSRNFVSTVQDTHPEAGELMYKMCIKKKNSKPWR